MNPLLFRPDRRIPALRITPSPRQRALGFRADIEGLRGIAVLLVVLYHARVPWMQGGYIGVDVFFVLSGYLITGLLVHEIETAGTLDLREFYARRIRRLLPASFLMLAAVVLFGMLVFAPLEQERIAQAALATSAYVSNFWFLYNTADYFAADAGTNPFLHTWSLAVEEQFYLVWPVLVVLALRGRSRRALAGVIVGVALASFTATLIVMRTSPSWAFFASPLRAWEFAIGGAAALLPTRRLLAHRPWGVAMGWAGVAAIPAAAVAYTEETAFPGVTALLPVLGTTIALVGGAGAPGVGVSRILGAGPLQWMGKHSYGWYLWHWPALVLAAAMVPGLSLAGALIAAAASLGVAALTFRHVESPIRFLPVLRSRVGLSIGLGLLLTAGGVVASQLLLRVAWRLSVRGEQKVYTSAYNDEPHSYDGTCSSKPTEVAAKPCVAGVTSSGTALVLFGDSHAAHWLPALDSVARVRGLRLVVFFKNSCPAAAVTIYSATLRRDFVECNVWRHDAMRQIRALRPLGVVLGSSMGYLRGVPGDHPSQRLSPDEWRDGYRQTLRYFDDAGVKTWVMRDNPRAEFNVPICLARTLMPLQRWIPKEDCDLNRETNVPEWVFAIEKQAAAGLAHVQPLDMTDQFCDGPRCAAIRNGKVVYRDADHLAATYSASIAPALGERLRLPPTSGELTSR